MLVLTLSRLAVAAYFLLNRKKGEEEEGNGMGWFLGVDIIQGDNFLSFFKIIFKNR